MAKELTFPITFDKCPLCGCKETIARLVADQEVERGKMAPGKATGTSVGGIMIIDQTKTVLSAPQITFARDICLECGFEYVVFVHCQEMAVMATSPKMPAL